MKVLVAEDDVNISKILKIYLQNEGYDVQVTFDGLETLLYLENNQVDLVLLDWMLPKMSGIEVCKEIRQWNQEVKIIMITAKTTNQDELLGLIVGADDYIRKPFDMKVLLQRVNNLTKKDKILIYKDIKVDTINYRVTLSGNGINLTRKEYYLLVLFLKNKNRILSRDQILDVLWDSDYTGDMRTVDTHIKRLRSKIGHRFIKTIVGIGYVMGDEYEEDLS